MSKQKCIYLTSGGEEGFAWELQVTIGEGTKTFAGHFMLEGEKDKAKSYIRSKDKAWIVNNIPSSLWWNLERHHNWEDGGRLYLLTKEEHKAITKEERRG